MTSEERGVNITNQGCINAIIHAVPPVFIFPRVFYKDNMLKEAPPGSLGVANQPGWSTEPIFRKFLDHFIEVAKPTRDNPILLTMDNHETHIYIEIIEKARQNGIILLTLPPHTANHLQPLDRTVFGPFKNQYNQAADRWMLNHPGKPITIYDVAEIAGEAYGVSFTPKNIVKAFETQANLNQLQNQDKPDIEVTETDQGPPINNLGIPQQHDSNQNYPDHLDHNQLSADSIPELVSPFHNVQLLRTPLKTIKERMQFSQPKYEKEEKIIEELMKYTSLLGSLSTICNFRWTKASLVRELILDSVRYLGIHLDRRLTWNQHIKSKRVEINIRHRNLYWMLGRNSRITLENKLLIYKSILKTAWTYGIQVWGSASNTNIAILQRVQNAILRTISNVLWFIRNSEIHTQLEMNTVKEEIQASTTKYQKRLENHPNMLAANLITRSYQKRLKRKDIL
ncbi:unnamed protein product [Leptosia nina]|uniref:DDE-1 domain-containing protein n=1 Tax=Leptosia nina TaxID=320188 RepID=A0AAV1JVM1_9NEOP